MITAVSFVLSIGDRAPSSLSPCIIASANPVPSNAHWISWVERAVHSVEIVIDKLDMIRILRERYIREVLGWRRFATRALMQIWQKGLELELLERQVIAGKAIGSSSSSVSLEEVFLMKELLSAPPVVEEASSMPPPPYDLSLNKESGQPIGVGNPVIDPRDSD